MFFNIQQDRVGLRTLSKTDYDTLHQWHNDLDHVHIWQVGRHVLSRNDFEAEFEKRLRRSIEHFFLICDTQCGKPIGMVYNYNADVTDQVCYLCLFLLPESSGKANGRIAGTLFLNYLFANCAYRKVYGEIFGYNFKVVRWARILGFRQEGCLQAHRYFAGRFWDLHLLSIHRDDFWLQIGK